MKEGRYTLEFPSRPPLKINNREDYLLNQAVCALGAEPSEVWRSRDILCVFDHPEQILSMTPNASLMGKVDLGTGG